jgi:hypothetical protein
VTLEILRRPDWLAAGALMLAMLSEAGCLSAASGRLRSSPGLLPHADDAAPRRVPAQAA